MKKVCPVCQATIKENDGQRSNECRRCKADLSELFGVWEAADAWLQKARRAYRKESFEEAANNARNALFLKHLREAKDLEILALFRSGRRDRSFALWLRTQR